MEITITFSQKAFLETLNVHNKFCISLPILCQCLDPVELTCGLNEQWIQAVVRGAQPQPPQCRLLQQVKAWLALQQSLNSLSISWNIILRLRPITCRTGQFNTFKDTFIVRLLYL